MEVRRQLVEFDFLLPHEPQRMDFRFGSSYLCSESFYQTLVFKGNTLVFFSLCACVRVCVIYGICMYCACTWVCDHDNAYRHMRVNSGFWELPSPLPCSPALSLNSKLTVSADFAGHQAHGIFSSLLPPPSAGVSAAMLCYFKTRMPGIQTL